MKKNLVVFLTLGILLTVSRSAVAEGGSRISDDHYTYEKDGLREHYVYGKEMCLDGGVIAACVDDKGTVSLTGGEGLVGKLYVNPNKGVIGACGGVGGGLGVEVPVVGGLKARGSIVGCIDNEVGLNAKISEGVTVGMGGVNSTTKSWVVNTHPPVQYMDQNGRFINHDVHATTPLAIDKPDPALTKINNQDE